MSVLKPEFTASIAQLKAGNDLPATLLAKLISENKSAFGLIVKDGNKLEIEKFPKIDSVDAMTEQMKNIEGNTKKMSRMYYFMDVQSPEFDEDEVMPLVLLKDSKNNPLLAVCVEGDFPTYALNDEGWSEAFCLVDQWLGPKIEQVYSMVGNNVQKVIDYLKTAQFSKDFEAALGGGNRGVLAFIPAQGDQFVIEKNTIGHSGDWGFVSNAYGYTESAVAAATPAPAEPPAKPKSKYASAPAEAPVVPPVKPVEPKPVVSPPALPVTPKTPEEKVAAEIVEGVDVEEEVDWTPPANVHGKNLKALYQATAGFLPKDWKQRPTLRIKVRRRVTSPAEIAATRQGMAANGSTVTPVKDMRGDTPTVIPAVLPILSAQQQARAMEHIKKILGDGSAVIADPIDAQKIEADMAMFSKLVLKSGNLEEVRRIPHAHFFVMAKEDPEALALMAIELRTIARKYWDLIADPSKVTQLINSIKTKTSAEPVKPSETGPSPEQVEVPTPAPAPSVPAPAPAEQPVVVRKRSRYAS